MCAPRARPIDYRNPVMYREAPTHYVIEKFKVHVHLSACARIPLDVPLTSSKRWREIPGSWNIIIHVAMESESERTCGNSTVELRAFECVLCSKEFTKSSSLIRHQKTQHGIQNETAIHRFTCPIDSCTVLGTFRTVSLLKKHCEEYHPGYLSKQIINNMKIYYTVNHTHKHDIK